MEKAGRARAGAADRRNLSLTQSVVSLLNEQLVENADDAEAVSLFNVPTMYRAARLVGDAVRAIRAIDGPALKRPRRGSRDRSSSADRSKTSVRGFSRSIRKATSSRATDETPFFQIGEHKYGKPILDRVAQPTMSLGEAAKLILLSFDSTLRSNLSVGMPIDIVLYERDSLDSPREAHLPGRRVLQEIVTSLVRGAALRLHEDRGI